MFSKTLKNVFKNLSLRSCTISLRKAEVKSGLLIDIDMLLMVVKGIRGQICHVIHQYAEANNKYIKDNHNNKELSYLKYWDVNNLSWLGNVTKASSE